MHLSSKTFLTCALLLAACDLGKTNLGELTAGTSGGTDDGDAETSGTSIGEVEPSGTSTGEVETEGEEPVDGSGSDCNGAWMVTPAVRDGDWTTANAVLALDDGFVLGASPDSDDVTRVDAGGATQWNAELGAPGASFVKDVLLVDGGYVVSIQEISPAHASGERLRVVRLSASGEQEWEADLGAAHYMAWMEADVLRHPEGGTVVSWHDSQDGGGDPRLVLARLDAAGAVKWSTAYPLAFDSPTAINWAHGAAAVLGDGSVLQLTSEDANLRLVRTAANGSLVSNAIVDVVAWPQDLIVLPDGAVLVLANDGVQVMVLEVETDGSIQSTHIVSGGDASFGDALVWDPSLEALLVAGTARDEEEGWERPWTLVVDRQGNELFNGLELEEPGAPGLALDVARIPSGGFVVTRHGGSLYYETVLPCG